MKKILFVINTMGCGGAEKALLELLKRLDSREYKLYLYVLLEQGELIEKLPSYVTVLNRRYNNASVLDKKGRRILIKTVTKDFFRNGKCFYKLGLITKNLLQMIKGGRVQSDKLFWRVVSEGAERFEETYDLAFAWMEGGASYYTAEHVKAVKKAALIHIDYENVGYTPEMDRNCWENFDRIFTVSDETKRAFLAVYPQYAPKADILPNIIDRESIRLRAKEKGGFSDVYDGFRLLTVGRLTYQKAFDIAIEAMKLLKEKGYRARWYVLGEGNERKNLEKKIAAFGLQEDFLLLGVAENPYPYYDQADVYIHATRFEGRSIGIQEAQVLGCAVIASDCSSNRQQIKDGLDGMLCPLEPGAIAESVASLLEDDEKRKKLGRAARDKETSGGKEIERLLELLV